MASLLLLGGGGSVKHGGAVRRLEPMPLYLRGAANLESNPNSAGTQEPRLFCCPGDRSQPVQSGLPGVMLVLTCADLVCCDGSNPSFLSQERLVAAGTTGPGGAA